MRPRLQLQAQLPYVEEFTDGQVKGIGSVEVLAATGLILPSVLRVAPLLSAAAAVGLVLLMIAAIATHARRAKRIHASQSTSSCWRWRCSWRGPGSATTSRARVPWAGLGHSFFPFLPVR